MRIKQLYIFLFFIWFGSTIIASTTDKADSWTKEKESIVHEVISTFHNSLGFDYLTREECDSLNADGLLSQLDESQRYYTYFELERILIKSSLFRGEIRMAIAQSDQMYSKARALAYPFGNALALNAMGEVYSYTGRLREAGAAYEESLRLLDGMDGEDVHIRMLLVELIDYNLRIRNVNGASRYLARLNLYPEDRLSPLELAMRHISNASCQLFKGDLKAASHCLVQIGQLEAQLIPEIRQYLLIIDARYLVATGEHEAALTAYNDFLQTEYARINHNIYKEALLEKADLLVKMGNKEEAYGQYGKVFSYIKTSFEKNYPKDRPALYPFPGRPTGLPERTRPHCIHAFLSGRHHCVRTVSDIPPGAGLEEDIPFEAFPDAAGGDEGESGASHTTEEYVSFEHEP